MLLLLQKKLITKRKFLNVLCGKERFFSRIKETYNSDTCPGRSYFKRTKKVLIATDEFLNIVKKCEDSYNEDFCLPEDTRKIFPSFDFTPYDAVDLWAVLKPVVETFHGNTENYYSNFYGLLQENLPPKKFGGDIALTNISLAEIDNHNLMHLSTKNVHYDNPTIKFDSVKLSKRELKSSQYIIGYFVQKLYS